MTETKTNKSYNYTEEMLNEDTQRIQQQNFHITDFVKSISNNWLIPEKVFCGLVYSNAATKPKTLLDILCRPYEVYIDAAIIYIKNNKTKETDNVLWDTTEDLSISEYMKKSNYEAYNYTQVLRHDRFKGCEIVIHYYIEYVNGYHIEIYRFNENHELIVGKEFKVNREEPYVTYLKENFPKEVK